MHIRNLKASVKGRVCKRKNSNSCSVQIENSVSRDNTKIQSKCLVSIPQKSHHPKVAGLLSMKADVKMNNFHTASECGNHNSQPK